MAPLQVEYKLTFAELYRTVRKASVMQRQFMRDSVPPTRLGRGLQWLIRLVLLLYFAGGIFVYVTILNAGSPEVLGRGFTLALIPWLAWLPPLILLGLVARWNLAHMIWNTNAGLRETIQLEADEEGLTCVTVTSRTLWRWPAFRHMQLTNDLLILYVGGGSFLPVPLRAFGTPAEAEAFASFVRSRLGPAPRGFPVLPTTLAAPSAPTCQPSTNHVDRV